MPTNDRAWLLRHLADEAKRIAALTARARDNASDQPRMAELIAGFVRERERSAA